MKINYARYLIGVQYKGPRFNGWNSSLDAKLPSVSETLKIAISKFIGERNFDNFRGTSRTDAGVHAIRNVFQVDLIKLNKYPNRASKYYTSKELLNALNFYLKSVDIFLSDCKRVSVDFDSRKNVLKRTYMYKIILTPCHTSSNIYDTRFLFHSDYAWILNKNLNIEKMNEAAQYLIGKHDFTSFRNSGCQSLTPIRTLTDLQIICTKNSDFNETRLLGKEDTEVNIIISADAFLYRMVRNIVAVLVKVGLEKYPPIKVKEILEARDKSLVNQMAPSQGLYLLNVHYSPNVLENITVHEE